MPSMAATGPAEEEGLALPAGDGGSSGGDHASFLSTFLLYIGAHELFSPQMWKAAMTELVATALLVFCLTTSIVSCLKSNESDPKLLIPIAVFIILFLFLLVTFPLSGGFMSPIFAFIAALRGVITFTRAAVYILAQCLGSIIAFLLIKDAMSPDVADKYSLGGCTIHGTGDTPGIGIATALVLEFACTFVVLYVGVTVVLDQKMSERLGLPMVCGMIAGSSAVAVFVSTTITGRAGYGGVGLNPARCLGPAVLRGGRLWEGHWVFWVGPFAACVAYYGFSVNLPTAPLVGAKGDIGILKMAGSCWRWRRRRRLEEKLGQNV
ncbi:aquaporin TIP1-2-like [Cucurbita maxima]|uniref:Aquaporin TIP1-2-like n=1 Tax=Cucurbita maxima TaxID=3661 RepID=A0A6J1JAF0_CUCMA|nr:aquaporin TIP1-2-like [Cucurbita maxima]